MPQCGVSHRSILDLAGCLLVEPVENFSLGGPRIRSLGPSSRYPTGQYLNGHVVGTGVRVAVGLGVLVGRGVLVAAGLGVFVGAFQSSGPPGRDGVCVDVGVDVGGTGVGVCVAVFQSSGPPGRDGVCVDVGVGEGGMGVGVCVAVFQSDGPPGGGGGGVGVRVAVCIAPGGTSRSEKSNSSHSGLGTKPAI